MILTASPLPVDILDSFNSRSPSFRVCRRSCARAYGSSAFRASAFSGSPSPPGVPSPLMLPLLLLLTRLGMSWGTSSAALTTYCACARRAPARRCCASTVNRTRSSPDATVCMFLSQGDSLRSLAAMPGRRACVSAPKRTPFWSAWRTGVTKRTLLISFMMGWRAIPRGSGFFTWLSDATGHPQLSVCPSVSLTGPPDGEILPTPRYITW